MKRRHLAAIAAAVLGLALLIRWGCGSPWPDHEGQIRQTGQLNVVGLRRGAPGTAYLTATGHYTPRASDHARTFRIREIKSSSLALIDAKGVATSLKVKWDASRSGRKGTFSLPEVPDGDYRLRATFETALAKDQVEVPLPLYTPARIHVITDRPLYEAGNVVRFRAVVLRASDLAPIDGRPGRWIVRDPNDEVLLEEAAPAGEFGVVAGSFPLDPSAASGSWHVQWVSDAASDDVEFAVRPFTLPRFRVEATADRPFYAANATPVIRGAVTYSSGAPVADAKLEVDWAIAGSWPPPVEWQERQLPKRASTGPDGRFELALPKIPDDLQGRVTLTARISAVDPAGDRAQGAASVLLSEDAIQVSAVTELGDGLVQGFNNRMYLRVTTPDGRVLQHAKIRVRRAWQATDPGVEAVVDEDGVAALQLDPGPPINVVVPAAPWRPQPRPPAVVRGDADELISGAGAPLVDQLELDRWLPALASCAKWFDPSHPAARVGLRVSASGAVLAASGAPMPLDQCVVGLLRGKRLPAGAERMYAVAFTYAEPDLPALDATIATALTTPTGFDAAIARLAASTRDCLPQDQDGALPRALTWRAQAGSKEVVLGEWLPDPQGGVASAAMPCVTARIRGALRLDAVVPSDSFGLVRFATSLPARTRQRTPQPTTMLGYELAVAVVPERAGADADQHANDPPPSTTLRLAPGQIPDLRMRVTPVLAKAGEPVTAELIRGPGFVGELPKELTLDCLKTHQVEKLDAEHRAKFVLAPDLEGWCEVTGGGTRALVYIKPLAELAVSVTPEHPRYAPGQRAKLEIRTWLAGKGAKAAVGLFGVDQSLEQLVVLAGPDDLGRVQPQVETTSPAFGEFDGQALTLGRIHGANAAAATVLRVSAIPRPPELDAVVTASASTPFDAVEELTDRFYVVLAELYVQARQWEATAPAAEKMRPAAMAELWKKALAACEQRGQRVDDAYGRKLRLRVLPPDLLALTDPHVVVTGTRLPEDVENWAAWVAKRRP